MANAEQIMTKKYRCSECSFATEIEPGLGDECPGCGSSSIEYRAANSNREILRDLIDDADEMTLVFIRERLLAVSVPYLTTPLAELEAEFGKDGIVGSGMARIYADAAKAVDAGLGF